MKATSLLLLLSQIVHLLSTIRSEATPLARQHCLGLSSNTIAPSLTAVILDFGSTPYVNITVDEANTTYNRFVEQEKSKQRQGTVYVGAYKESLIEYPISFDKSIKNSCLDNRLSVKKLRLHDLLTYVSEMLYCATNTITFAFGYRPLGFKPSPENINPLRSLSDHLRKGCEHNSFMTLVHSYDASLMKKDSLLHGLRLAPGTKILHAALDPGDIAEMQRYVDVYTWCMQSRNMTSKGCPCTEEGRPVSSHYDCMAGIPRNTTIKNNNTNVPGSNAKSGSRDEDLANNVRDGAGFSSPAVFGPVLAIIILLILAITIVILYGAWAEHRRQSFAFEHIPSVKERGMFVNDELSRVEPIVVESQL